MNRRAYPPRRDDDDRAYDAWLDQADGITRLGEAVNTATMEPYLAGDGLEWHEEDITTRTWRCNTCGLVWDRRHRAVSCAQRGHVARFEDRYPYQIQTAYGPRVAYNTYTRVALRRDRAEVKA